MFEESWLSAMEIHPSILDRQVGSKSGQSQYPLARLRVISSVPASDPPATQASDLMSSVIFQDIDPL